MTHDTPRARLRFAMPRPVPPGLWRRVPPAIFPPILGAAGLALAWLGGVRAFALPPALAELMAGRAAERLVLGAVSAGAGGPPDSDLALATRVALDLETRYGLGAEGPLANGPGELLDDRQRDVGIEQRPADVPDRAVDVGLGEAPLAAKVLEGRGQAVGQGGEHRDRVAVGVLPPRGRPPDVAGTATVPGDLASTPDRRGRAPAVDRRARRGGAGQPRSGPSAATMRSPRSAAEAPGASARPSAPVTTRVSHA